MVLNNFNKQPGPSLSKRRHLMTASTANVDVGAYKSQYKTYKNRYKTYNNLYKTYNNLHKTNKHLYKTYKNLYKSV